MNNKLPLMMILALSLATGRVGAQTTLDWHATFVVRHPAGIYDTLIVGFDVNGDMGYQTGLDEIDTLFVKPISIRSSDSIILHTYSTCPANMKQDIRKIKKTLVFPIYIKSDTFPDTYNHNADSMVALIYDTSQFHFDTSQYKFLLAGFNSYGSYMDGIDNDEYWIQDKFGVFSYADGDIALIYEQNPNEYYWGICGTVDKIFGMAFILQFEKVTGITSIKEEQFLSLFYNSHYNRIELIQKPHKELSYLIHTIQGKKVKHGIIPIHEQDVNIPALPAGIYLLTISCNQFFQTLKFMIP